MLPARRISTLLILSPQIWTRLILIKKVSRQGELKNGVRIIDCFGINLAVFLERLQSFRALPPTHIKYLGELYSLATTGNAELRFRYYQTALLDPSTPASKEVARSAVDWVVGNDGTGVVKGRMKFCRPVLRDANKADPEYTKATYTKYKTSFHPIAQNLIDKVSALK